MRLIAFVAIEPSHALAVFFYFCAAQPYADSRPERSGRLFIETHDRPQHRASPKEQPTPSAPASYPATGRARQTGSTASARQERPAKPNLAAAAGVPHKRGPSGKEVSGSRQRTTGIRPWRTDTRSARHRLSTHLHRSFAFHGRPVASYVPGTNRKADAFCVGSPYCIQESNQYL